MCDGRRLELQTGGALSAHTPADSPASPVTSFVIGQTADLSPERTGPISRRRRDTRRVLRSFQLDTGGIRLFPLLSSVAIAMLMRWTGWSGGCFRRVCLLQSNMQIGESPSTPDAA